MMGDQHSQSSGNPASAEPRYDHIARVRTLVWSLKEDVQNLLKISAANLNQNSAIDSGQKAPDDKALPRFDKAFEDFHSLLNQIELHLKTIQECAIQQRQSGKYMPYSFKDKGAPHKPETQFIESTGPDHDISYAQYIHTIKGQISFIESLEKILLDGAKKIATSE